MVSRSSGKSVSLTDKEAALLEFLFQTDGAHRDDILASVWGYNPDADTHTLETHISGLRRKLGDRGQEIFIVEQGRYKINPDWLVK